MFKKICEFLFGKPYVAEQHSTETYSEPSAETSQAAMKPAKVKKPRKAAPKKKKSK